MTPCWAATRALRVFKRQFTTHNKSIQDDIRQLMVHCAQPVAIITTRLDSTPSHHTQGVNTNGKQERGDHGQFHGATVSSFSSIAMHPHPMISFSLQLPSRLATALRPTSSQATPPHFVVNILSAPQASLAKRFAKRDPFTSLPLSEEVQLGNGVTLTKEGQPLLLGCLGNLTCTVVRSIPLDFTQDPQALIQRLENSHVGNGDAIAQTSELFIARVLRVEQRHYGPDDEDYHGGMHTRHEEPEGHKPMVYYQKEFLTVKS